MTETQIRQARQIYRHFFRFMAAAPETNWVAMPTHLAECGCYIVPIDESINCAEPLVQNVQSMTEDTFILRLVDARKGKIMTETAEKLIEALHAELDKIHQRLDEVTKLCAKEVAPKAEPTLYALPGEHYAGLVLDDTTGKPSHHLVLLAGDAEELTWAEANAWAAEHGGHLPTRQEQALLFANLKREFEGAWYWSGEKSSSDPAWVQNFSHGGQDGITLSTRLRVRAVRRVEVNVPQEQQ